MPEQPIIIWITDGNLNITNTINSIAVSDNTVQEYKRFAADEINKHHALYQQVLMGSPGTYANSVSSLRMDVFPLRDSQDEIIGCITLAFRSQSDLAPSILHPVNQEKETLSSLLDKLHQIQHELSQSTTLDGLCRQGIELGMAYLGFDRLTMCLVADDPQYVRGMYGADENGQVIDERAVYQQITAIPALSAALTGENKPLVLENILLYNAQDEIIIQQGWSAVFALWNGSQIIGWLIGSSTIHHRPITQRQLELLELYGNLLTVLCTLKRVEEALKKGEHRFRSIFEGTRIGIAVIDLSGQLISYNAAFSQIFGYSALSLRDRTFQELIDPNDPQGLRCDFYRQLQDGVDNAQFEVQTPHHDGVDLWLSINLSLFPNPETESHYVVAFVEDVTERRQIEEQAQLLALERERVNLLSEFVQNISHDFKTPLTIINTSLYLLERSANPEIRHEQASNIADQVQHISTLLDGLLAMVKWDSGFALELQKLKVNTVIQDAIGEVIALIRQKSINLTLNLDANMPMFEADQYALNEALANLLKNAAQYTPDFGSIFIDTLIQDNELVIAIQDTGVGIEDRDLPHIFNRLYRADKVRSTRGLGLGLSIARKIIENHGGRIEVESVLGSGSTFRVFLPLR